MFMSMNGGLCPAFVRCAVRAAFPVFKIVLVFIGGVGLPASEIPRALDTVRRESSVRRGSELRCR